MRITVKQLKRLIKESIAETLNWDDHFSNDRESGREGREELLQIAKEKFAKGAALSEEELQALFDELKLKRGF
jgi:hypothetical protein